MAEYSEFGGRIISDEERKQRGDRLSKSYVLRSPEGRIVLIRNMRQFCLENGLNAYCMNRVLKGHHRSHRGWTAGQEEHDRAVQEAFSDYAYGNSLREAVCAYAYGD